MANGLRAAPIGLLAVIASFLLLGLGTVAALTRDVWHRHELPLMDKPIGNSRASRPRSCPFH